MLKNPLSKKPIIVLVVCFALCMAGCSPSQSPDPGQSHSHSQSPGPNPGQSPSQNPNPGPGQSHSHSQSPDPSTSQSPSSDVYEKYNSASTATVQAATTSNSVSATQAEQTGNSASATQAEQTGSVPPTQTTPPNSKMQGPDSESKAQTAPPITSAPAADMDITVIVSGQKISFSGQKPVAKDGEVFVPVLGVFENLTGANGNKSAPFSVKWDETTSTAIISNIWYTVKVTAGEDMFTCSGANGATTTHSAPSQTNNGVFMLPLRAIAEAIDATVEWSEATRTVSIYYESMIVSS